MIKKGRKVHTKASIKKMLASRRRNMNLKANGLKDKETINIALPGVKTPIGTEIPYTRISTPEENLEILYAKHSQHFSPAEQREIEEAIRLLRLLNFIVEVTRKQFPF